MLSLLTGLQIYYIQYAYRVGHKLLRHTLKFFNISKEIIWKIWKISLIFSAYALSTPIILLKFVIVILLTVLLWLLEIMQYFLKTFVINYVFPLCMYADIFKDKDE